MKYSLTDVIATGKSHGAREEDIFGCLYFYLREKLVEFKAKLSSVNITFYLSSMDSRELATGIKASNHGTTSAMPHHWYPPGLPTKFDRIDVSNTVDDFYVGYDRTLADWGTLLNASNAHSTLLAYSMNWAWKSNGGLISDNQALSDRITKKFILEKVTSRSGVMTSLTKNADRKIPAQWSFFPGLDLHFRNKMRRRIASHA
jgi:hypothetical protein